MEQIMFQVQGSASEPYIVEFVLNDKKLSATCSCPAGVNGLHCKHRFNIMMGTDSGIVSGNKDGVKKVVAWLVGTDVEKAISDVLKNEEELEKVKTALTNAKKRLVKALRASS